jgi:hypothetical protein
LHNNIRDSHAFAQSGTSENALSSQHRYCFSKLGMSNAVFVVIFSYKLPYFQHKKKERKK